MKRRKTTLVYDSKVFRMTITDFKRAYPEMNPNGSLLNFDADAERTSNGVFIFVRLKYLEFNFRDFHDV
mgnify:CR=1 FL=1